MANEDDRAKRGARAKLLRAQIEALSIKEPGKAEHVQGIPRDRSPRDFVHERMHELDEEETTSGNGSNVTSK